MKEQLEEIFEEYQRDKIEWISVDERLPELKTYFDKTINSNVTEVTKKVIVSDGIDSWIETYSGDFVFHESITEWMYLPLPKSPINKQ